jgi:hypothetical protein
VNQHFVKLAHRRMNAKECHCISLLSGGASELIQYLQNYKQQGNGSKQSLSFSMLDASNSIFKDDPAGSINANAASRGDMF